MNKLKKRKETIKQIVLSFIAVFLILVGYLNYNLDEKNNSIEVSSRSNEINLGDVELVNSDAIVENEENFKATGIVSNEDINTLNVTNGNIIVNENKSKISTDNYFEETRIERDRMYSEMIETYQKLVDNQSTPADQKFIAIQEISNITKIKNGIMISENLIKNKGFENVIILVNNGKASIVVKSQKLTQEQISQIQNIAQRELNVQVANISISNKY